MTFHCGTRESPPDLLSLPISFQVVEQERREHNRTAGVAGLEGWVQATLLVVLFGFFVLGFLALRTYQEKPPIPERVVDPQGALIYSAEAPSRGASSQPRP